MHRERQRRKEKSDYKEKRFTRSGIERGREKEDWKQKMLLWGRKVRLPGTEIVISVKKLHLGWRLLEAHDEEKSCMTPACSTRRRGWTLALQLMANIMFMTRGCSQLKIHSTLYRPKKDADSDAYGGADEQLEKIMKTERFKPDKSFTGTSERTGPRDRPVEFEKEPEEADPFGLDQFLTEVKKGKKAMEKVGGSGTMKASAGSSMRDGYEGGSSRSRIGMERGR